jgi:hypothetical protein
MQCRAQVRLGARRAFGHGMAMRFGLPPVSAQTAVRLLAAISVALGLMCVGLALAWRGEREAAACWRAAAEYKLDTDGRCGG